MSVRQDQESHAALAIEPEEFRRLGYRAVDLARLLPGRDAGPACLHADVPG